MSGRFCRGTDTSQLLSFAASQGEVPGGLIQILFRSTFGVGAAAPESLSCSIACLTDTNFESASTTRAKAFRERVVSLFQTLYMLVVGSERTVALPALQRLHHYTHLRFVKHRLLKGLDVADAADALGDIVRHDGLETATADEGDYRMNVLWWNAEQRF